MTPKRSSGDPSLETLLVALSALSLEEKRRLSALLEEEIAQAEEEAWDRNPMVRAEIRAARDAYDAGDFVTVDDYLASHAKLTS